MRGKRGQKVLVGWALMIVVFLFFITMFSLIPIFKQVLDDARGDSNLNCPGTPNFNQSDYDDDDSFEQLTRRPTCFTTGIYMVYFVGAFLIASIVWLFKNFRKT